MTVGDLISESLQRVGVLAESETASAAQMAIGLSALNSLIDQWALDSLKAYTVTRSTATLTASQPSFTVGAGGNINIARPTRNNLQTVKFQDTSLSIVTEFPLEPMTDDGYALVVQKPLTSTLPTSYYYNPTYPLGTLIPWPIPTSATLQWVVYSLTAVTEFTSLVTVVALPPGYRQMYLTNLGLELLQFFPERGVPETLPMAAQQARADVERGNSRLTDLAFDPASLVQGQGWAGYNIRTDVGS